MKKDELYSKILGCSVATYYNYLKEDRPIINFLKQFSLEELEEFAKTGEILSLELFNNWKNNPTKKEAIIKKLSSLVTLSNIENENYIKTLDSLFAYLKDLFEPKALRKIGIDYDSAFGFFIFDLMNDAQSALELERGESFILFNDIHSFTKLTSFEIEYLSYCLNDNLKNLIEYSASKSNITIDEMRVLVIISLIVNDIYNGKNTGVIQKILYTSSKKIIISSYRSLIGNPNENKEKER